MTPHKITPDEYHQMGPIFLDTRLELIEGELFDMVPIGTAHFWTVAQLTHVLTLHLAKQAFIVCQGPLSLPDSEPEPDVMALKPADYRHRLPELLIIAYIRKFCLLANDGVASGFQQISQDSLLICHGMAHTFSETLYI